jgi:hypothetical protein
MLAVYSVETISGKYLLRTKVVRKPVSVGVIMPPLEVT